MKKICFLYKNMNMFKKLQNKKSNIYNKYVMIKKKGLKKINKDKMLKINKIWNNLDYLKTN